MIRSVCVAVAFVLALATSVQAQSVGVRTGVSGNPDQFVIGGHLETGPLIERLTFRPNIEVGIGDDVTLVAVNLELVYSIPLRQHPWRVYCGGGPAANVYVFDGDSDIGGGFNVLLGLQHRRGLFTELKVGAIDSADIKFLVGYAF